MALSETLLVDFDQEMANTRKTLERVPVEKPDWKPHERSMPLGRLANHVADLPSWATFTIEKDSLDIAPPGAPPYQPPPPPTSRQELLEKFDKSVAAARAALAGAGERRAPAEDVDSPFRWKDRLQLAAHGRSSHDRDEPHDPSPRSARRLFTAE